MAFDLRALRYFVQVAEQGNLSRAARSLHIAQPALTQRIAGLEAHLGVQLFVRSPHGMELTQDGRRLLDGASDLVARAQALEEAIGAATGPVRGTVRLGMPAATANALVEPLVERLADRHPALRLRIDEARTTALLDGLTGGQHDLAITASLGGGGRIHGDALAMETLHLVGATDTALGETIAFADLAGLPLALSSRSGERPTMLDREAGRRGLTLDIALESTSLATSKRLIAAGRLFGIMTWSAVAEQVASGTLKAARIVDPVFPRPLFLCQLPDRRHDRATQILAREVAALVDELTAAGVLR